jgi:hypothetical protein
MKASELGQILIQADVEDYDVYWYGKDFETILIELVEEVAIDNDKKRILLG